MQGEGPMFRIGAVRSESVDHEHDPNNPNCFAWCLMNLCIAKMLQSAIRKVLNAASLEVLGELALCNNYVTSLSHDVHVTLVIVYNIIIIMYI